MLCYVMLCYVMLCYVMLCLNSTLKLQNEVLFCALNSLSSPRHNTYNLKSQFDYGAVYT